MAKYNYDFNYLTDFNTVLNTLDEYAKEFEDMLKRSLVNNDRVATGTLLSSIETEVRLNGLTMSVVFKAEDYLQWVNNGRKGGKFPPPDKILEWVIAKPVLPRPMGNGKLPTQEQLAFLIGRKIAREGYKGSHDVEMTTETLNAKYMPRLQEALQADFERYWSIKVLKTIGHPLRKLGLVFA